MNRYVIYNATYHILICRQCGYAIPQDWILRHFRQLHKAIPLTIRSEIIEHGKSLNLWQPRDVQAVWETNAHQCSQLFIRLFGYSRINELNMR